MQYYLTHQSFLDVDAFLGGAAQPASRVDCKKRLFLDFFATCRSPEERVLAPFPKDLEQQCRSGNFAPYQCLRQLALIELVDQTLTDLPFAHDALLTEIRRCRAMEQSPYQVLSEVHEAAVQRLLQYSRDSARRYANMRFLNLTRQDKEGKVTKIEDSVGAQEAIRHMVNALVNAMEKEGIDMTAFKPNHFATLSVYYSKFLRMDKSKPINGLARWCHGLMKFVPGSSIEPDAERRVHLASQCLPRHYDASGALQPAGLESSGQAIASAPVTCELCHAGFAGHDKLAQHYRTKHASPAEARKRIFYKAREAGYVPLLPWVKRNMVQGYQFFRLHSVPSSVNDWTMKATTKAVHRREEACAICAMKDWLENRHEVYLFQEGTQTTTWRRHFYASGDEEPDDVDDGEDEENASGGKHSAHGTLLVEDNGIFCLGRKEKINAILDVHRYITHWPLIPADELHASSVQHPDDVNMRWLLHSRRVKCTPSGSSSASLPRSAGVGVKNSTVWCCKLCVDHLCTAKPMMPPLALADAFFLGRHPPLFREATLATRMLASSGRLLMRQLFLGRGADDEVHKGVTGNTMLIAQPAPSYEQVLPNMTALTESIVVLFCKSIDDVSKAQVLVVNREEYRALVHHRKQVCPVFANTSIDEVEIDKLPDGAVPDALLQSAQVMPEASSVKTTMHGPANRIPMFARQEASDQDDKGNDSDESTPADTPGNDSGDPQPADTPGNDSGDPHSAETLGENLAAEELNEHETIIGMDEQSCPKPLRLFQAWNASMEKLNAEAAKFAQSSMQQAAGDDSARVATQKAAAKELVRNSIAVDMIDIAKQMTKTNGGREAMERLATAQTDNEKKMPIHALAVPSGKPLSIFDPSALPAAYTEFRFGDCVPFLKRETPVTCQQIFDALPNREELEYSLPQDEEPFVASSRSRFDSPEFYAVFATFLRSLKLLQSTKAAVDKVGFGKDFKTIASLSSQDFVSAALHESQPRTNQDLITTAGNEKVRTALLHLGFSTATVPLTDGNKLRLHHFGCAMNQIFGPLTVVHTHHYADNYSPEILMLQSTESPVRNYIQNKIMPTLQQMHKNTAASPRSTAKLFLLLEELSYKHLYRVDRAKFGNFCIRPVTGSFEREDDYASNGLRGLADFVTALLKCIESQARGFAHGHGKCHSIPDGTRDLLKSLENVIQEIHALECATQPVPSRDSGTDDSHPASNGSGSGGAHPAEDVVEALVAAEMQSYNDCLIASASTRQYESATLPARQLGQEVRDAPFSEKQQRQSRYDGSLENDNKTPRPLVPIVPPEPAAHIAREHRRADCGQQMRRNEYKEVPLTGCQLCIAPHYLLPHSFGLPSSLGEEGEIDHSDAAELPGLPWEFDCASGELQHYLADLQGNIATAPDFHRDACEFEKSFALDVRFLHHYNHDHDCTGTCVKNMKNKTKEQLAKLLKANRAPPCHFECYHTVLLLIAGKIQKIRRRGKEIVEKPHILNTTSRNQFGLVALERPQPFRSPSTDCGLATLRCNNDFRYMPRGFADATTLSESFRCDIQQLAACFRAMKGMIQTHAAVRRMAMSVVALHVVARIVDYYITKYAAKPMEQLQNLVTQYALGLKRLEVEEEQEKTAIATAGAVEQRTNEPDDVKARSLRVFRRLQHSANRSKWISSTECALFVHTEQQHWTSHNEVPMFLSRPLYQISECKRILSGSKHMLTRAAPSVNFSVLDFAPAADAEPLVKRRRLTRKCPATGRASACGGPHPAAAAPPALDAP